MSKKISDRAFSNTTSSPLHRMSYEYIGAIVEKKFKIGVFRGTVDRFELSELDDGSLAPIFHVTYTDDDTEEFLLEGLKKILVAVVTQKTNVAPAEAEPIAGKEFNERFGLHIDDIHLNNEEQSFLLEFIDETVLPHE